MIRKAVLGTVLAAACGAAFAALPNVAVYATGGTIAGPYGSCAGGTMTSCVVCCGFSSL